MSPTYVSLPGLAPIWRADRLDSKTLAGGHPTGYEALDAELPERGWPRAGMVEILGAHEVGSEWSLLAPWLRRPVVDGGPIVCLAPPHEPNAPALLQLGIPVERLLLVRASSAADTAWAGEQALQVMSCQAILWWVGANFLGVTPLMLRRLHLASMARPTPVFVLSPASARQRGSPAPLRLALNQMRSKLAVTVFKRRGPSMNAPIELDHQLLDEASCTRWRALTSTSLGKPSRAAKATAVADHVLARPVPADLTARGC